MIARTKLALTELFFHSRELFIGFSLVACVFVAAAAVSVAIDVHAMRVNSVTTSAQLLSEIGSRLDALSWKFDTFNTNVLALSKTLATALTQMRVQVEQASVDQTKAIAATAKTTEQAVAKTLDALPQPISSTPAPQPIVQVEPAKSPAPSPVVTPQVILNPVLAPPVNQTVEPRKSSWRWLRWLWPFHHARRAQ